MSPYCGWLARALADGQSVQDGPPALPDADRPAVDSLLRAAFDRHALDVAGPPVAFDPAAGIGAAMVLARACWQVVGGGAEPLALDAEPRSAAAHLSADVTLRLMPSVLGRAKARDPGGEPAAAVERLLRAWPLSGVLADLDGGPTTPPEFDGHPGLQLLYAERLVATTRPGWVPAAGAARDWVERVFAERGRPVPAPPPTRRPPVADEPAAALHARAADPLKTRFVGRDEVVDLIALAAVAGEHLFLYGPPGTAKSLVVREFAAAVRCRYFEYLLTRFSEPNELFGPVDLARLREGVVATVVTGMLPEAEFAFLDELFNANSAILNNLLTVLNERVYRRGAETHRLPLVSAFAASNHLPEDDALQALFDRFLLRCKVDSLPRPQLPALLAAGWAIERDGKPPPTDGPTADDLRALGRRARDVDLGGVLDAYADAVGKARDLGVGLSDRRAVKVLKLVAASAVLSGRAAANPSDLWVLRYVWDRVEQIGPLAALVAGVLDAAGPAESPHPRAARPEQPDPEELAADLDRAEADLPGARTPAELARLRERVQAAADRAAWVADAAARDHLLARAAALAGRIG